jgi:1-phosphofructokinase
MYRDGASQFEKRLMLNSTPYDFIWCEGSVRTNIKVFDRSTGTITELNESGMNVTEENLSKMVDLVVRHAENSDYLILSGSLPPGCPQDYYRTLIHAVEGLGCRCVLDADGERLKFGLEARPFMIKPNRYELETMIGRPLDGITDTREAALRYIDMGVQVVSVSLGADGALITDGSETLFAPRMNIEVKGTVGAGDAMVAGLVAGFMADWDLEQCFRMGVACASTRCITEGYKTIDKTVYKAFLNMVKIERV